MAKSCIPLLNLGYIRKNIYTHTHKTAFIIAVSCAHIKHFNILMFTSLFSLKVIWLTWSLSETAHVSRELGFIWSFLVMLIIDA